MKKNIIIGVAVLLLTIILNVFRLNLVSLLVCFCLSYLLYVFLIFLKVKSLKELILSPSFVLGTVFFVYAIPSTIMFLMDGGVPRVDFFRIDEYTMTKTLYLYYNIFMIFFALIFLFGKIKAPVFAEKKENYLLGKRSWWSLLFDILAAVAVVYFYYLHFRNGFSVLGEYFHTIRDLIQSGVHNLNSYIYLFMIPYSYIFVMDFISSKFRLKTRSVIRLVFIIAFWGLSLFTDRRNFVTLLVMLIVTLLALSRKVKLKSVVIITSIIIALLLGSFLRSGTKAATPQSIYYYLNGEFILTNYVSQYYIDLDDNFKYGSTYFLDTITAPIPRFIYKEKPEMLSVQFQEDAKTNVAYAFNPVAEGLVNFGYNGALICVPLVLWFFVSLAYWLGKYRLDYYAVLIASYIGFCRGIFSVSVFSIACICLIIFLIRKTSDTHRSVNYERIG